MSARLDDLLKEKPAAPATALERARSGMLQELALKRPARKWRVQAALLIATIAAIVAAVGVALALAGQLDAEALRARAPLMVGLLVAGAVGAYAALRPMSRGVLLGALVLLVGGTIAIVLLRGEGSASSVTPQWVCTATHLGVAVLPLLVALRFLTGAAPSALRSAVAGLSVGVVGSAVGELSCGRGWEHVLLFHVTAWVAVAVVAIVGRALAKTRSFAP